MKRHVALQTLSREHHTALTLALACKRAAQSGSEESIRDACEKVRHVFAAELDPHFRVEEEALLPLLQQAGEAVLVHRTLDEHAALRAQSGALRSHDPALLAAFGKALSDHVRFEESQLFPSAEQVVPLGQLEIALGKPARTGK